MGIEENSRDNKKEYKLAKGWAVFIYLFAPLLIGLFGWLLALPFLIGDFSPNASWIFIPVAIPMIFFILVGIIDTYKGRILIHEDRIVSISAFSVRELNFCEIKGYTVNSKYIFIEPNDAKKKRIKISQYIGGYNEVLFWVIRTFVDLYEQNVKEEEQGILNNERYGWSKEIREQKLVKAKQVSRVLNWTSGITAAWAIFFPTPFQITILTAIVIPVLALLVIRLSRGLIRFDEKEGSAYPSVVYTFVFPSLGLALRAFMDYEIFDYSNVWRPNILITISFLFLLITNQKELAFKKTKDYLTVAALAIFLFAYGYGVVIHLNCFYDNTEAQYYTAIVLDKRINHGRRSTHYDLELSAWGPQKEVKKVSVGKGLYNRIETDDEVNIYFRNGKLNIPWFIVTNK